MKLLFCPDCGYVFSLGFTTRTCECGKVSGRYVNRSQAEVNGEGISLAIGNGSLMDAIANMKRMERIQGADRAAFKDNCRVAFCWVRPHQGDGNPHTSVKKPEHETS